MSTGKVLLGVLAGAAAGALLGVLLAPDKGSVTREKLAKIGEDYAGDITDKIKELRETINEKMESFKGEGANLAEKAGSKLHEATGGMKTSGAGSHSSGNKYSSNT